MARLIDTRTTTACPLVCDGPSSPTSRVTRGTSRDRNPAREPLTDLSTALCPDLGTAPICEQSARSSRKARLCNLRYSQILCAPCFTVSVSVGSASNDALAADAGPVKSGALYVNAVSDTAVPEPRRETLRMARHGSVGARIAPCQTRPETASGSRVTGSDGTIGAHGSALRAIAGAFCYQVGKFAPRQLQRSLMSVVSAAG